MVTAYPPYQSSPARSTCPLLLAGSLMLSPLWATVCAPVQEGKPSRNRIPSGSWREWVPLLLIKRPTWRGPPTTQMARVSWDSAVLIKNGNDTYCWYTQFGDTFGVHPVMKYSSNDTDRGAPEENQLTSKGDNFGDSANQSDLR